MRISFNDKISHDSGVLVLLQSSTTLNGITKDIDQKLNGQVRKILGADSFSFKKGSIVKLPQPAGLPFSEVIVIGVDAEKPLSAQDIETLGAKIHTSLGNSQEKYATIVTSEIKANVKDLVAPALIANGVLLKSWCFDDYRTQLEKSDRCQTKRWEFITDDTAAAKADFKTLEEISEGVFLTRHVVSEPPNVIYPKTLAERAKELEKLGVRVEIFDEKDLKKLGLNALLGVGLGSEKESHMVVMHWEGGKKDADPIAFVGKGVTFDTGGISIKPAGDMDEMKWDMAGAGVVLGLMRALAGRKAKVNAIGVMGLVENMPSGSAQRPGDIVKSLSGQTIEILNTDAEGRLVLADALWYTQDRFKPKTMIDLATLTGAIIISLGNEHAGLFSNSDELANNLADCGLATGEKLWRLPLAKAYDKDIDSVVADMKNIGSGRGAGSITAAQFLQRFVNKTTWAHLDIAGTSWNKKGGSLAQAGATAFGVRLLNHFVATHYEH